MLPMIPPSSNELSVAKKEQNPSRAGVSESFELHATHKAIVGSDS